MATLPMRAGGPPLRDQLIDLVGIVSRRLGRLLELTPSLEEGDRGLVNRMARDVTALQTSVLEALYSNALSSPASMRELYDLELGALYSLEKVEAYIFDALQQRTLPVAAVPTPWFSRSPHPSESAAYLGAAPAGGGYIDAHFEPVTGTPSPITPQPSVITPLVPVPAVAPSHPAQGTPYSHTPHFQVPHSGAAFQHAIASIPPVSDDGVIYGAPAVQPAYSPPPHHHAGAYHAALPVPVRAPSGRQVVAVPTARRQGPEAQEAAPALPLRVAALAQRVASSWRVLTGVAVAAFLCLVVVRIFAPAAPLERDNADKEAAGQRRIASTEASGRDERLPSAAHLPAADDANSQATGLAANGRSRELFVPVIATVATRDGIEEKLAELRQTYPTFLSGETQTGIEPILGADGRQWYRAYLLPGRAYSMIRDYCRGLREAGYVQCWAKPLGRPRS